MISPAAYTSTFMIMCLENLDLADLDHFVDWQQDWISSLQSLYVSVNICTSKVFQTVLILSRNVVFCQATSQTSSSFSWKMLSSCLASLTGSIHGNYGKKHPAATAGNQNNDIIKAQPKYATTRIQRGSVSCFLMLDTLVTSLWVKTSFIQLKNNLWQSLNQQCSTQEVTVLQ